MKFNFYITRKKRVEKGKKSISRASKVSKLHKEIHRIFGFKFRESKMSVSIYFLDFFLI